MKCIVFVTCLVLALGSGSGWTTLGPGAGVAHAAPACSKVDLCLSAQSNGTNWWIVIGGQHLQAGTYVQYAYSSGSGLNVFGAVLVSANNGSLSYVAPGGPCPSGIIIASASGTTSKGAGVSATLNSPGVC